MQAIAKIREFILQKIYSYRKPMSNYQIPQNTMLKFRFFNEFLMANERHIAREVRDEYIDTLSKMYYSYFKGYLSRLMKLQVCVTYDKSMIVSYVVISSFVSFYSVLLYLINLVASPMKPLVLLH